MLTDVDFSLHLENDECVVFVVEKNAYYLPNYLFSVFDSLSNILNTCDSIFSLYLYRSPYETNFNSVWDFVPEILQLLYHDDSEIRIVATKVLHQMCIRDPELAQSQLNIEVYRVLKKLLSSLGDYPELSDSNEDIIDSIKAIISSKEKKKLLNNEIYTDVIFCENDDEKPDKYEQEYICSLEKRGIYFSEPFSRELIYFEEDFDQIDEEFLDFREPLNYKEKEFEFLPETVEKNFLDFKYYRNDDVLMLEENDLDHMHIKYVYGAESFDGTYYHESPEERLLHCCFGRCRDSDNEYKHKVQEEKACNTIETKALREKKSLPFFKNSEEQLSEHAGNPGLVEYLVLQSKQIMKFFHATFGYQFLLLASSLDVIIRNTVGWVQGIFYTWCMWRSFRKKNYDDSEDNVAGWNNDFTLTRMRIRRFFGWGDFEFAEGFECLKNKKLQTNMTSPTFGLQLVIEMRQQIDEMKRDLHFLTSYEMEKLADNSFKDFLISFIPNPFQIINEWKDIFLLTFRITYTRTDFRNAYIDSIVSHKNITALLKKERDENEESFLACENELVTAVNYDDSTPWIHDEISKYRSSLQRLLQISYRPTKIINPENWPRGELLIELRRMQIAKSYRMSVVLECESWLTQEILKILHEKQIEFSIWEKELQKKELQDHQQRKNLQANLCALFI